jgi:hypothetical protein
MGAPIQRYGDSRLCGTALVKPFSAASLWTRTGFNPILPNSEARTAEVALRIFKVFTGFVAMAATFAVALIGRLIQILHYHWISSHDRNLPGVVAIEGLGLPIVRKLLAAPEFFQDQTVYLEVEGFSAEDLRWGFSVNKKGIVPYQACFKSQDSLEMEVFLDLDLKEIAVVDMLEAGFPKDKLPQLLAANGYKAFMKRNDSYLTVLDPSILSVQSVLQPPSEAQLGVI